VLLSIELRQFVPQGGHFGLDGNDPVAYPETFSTGAQAVRVLDGVRHDHPDLLFQGAGHPPAVSAPDARDRPAGPAAPVDRGAMVHLTVVGTTAAAAADQAPEEIGVPPAGLTGQVGSVRSEPRLRLLPEIL
jgi:hypothetical protein